MSLTITLGWWIIPALITVTVLVWSWRERDPLVGAFQLLAALAITGFSWAIYLAARLWSQP